MKRNIILLSLVALILFTGCAHSEHVEACVTGALLFLWLVMLVGMVVTSDDYIISDKEAIKKLQEERKKLIDSLK